VWCFGARVRNTVGGMVTASVERQGKKNFFLKKEAKTQLPWEHKN
jgi:hypothetical protein